MLLVIAIVFGVLWLLGLVTSVMFHGFVHVLLFLAVVSLLFHFLRNRHAVVRP